MKDTLFHVYLLFTSLWIEMERAWVQIRWAKVIMAFLLCMWVCALRLQEASVIFKLNYKLQFHHELSEASLSCSVWIFVHQQKATNERSSSSGSVITLFFSPSYWNTDWNNHNNIKLMGQLWLISMVIKSNAVLHRACIKSNEKNVFNSIMMTFRQYLQQWHGGRVVVVVVGL